MSEDENTSPQLEEKELSPQPVNYHQLRQEAKKAQVGELWDLDKNLFENVENILTRSLVLPEMAIQLPIITAFLLLPHPILELSPILWVQGASGTGKTQITMVAKFLHKVPLLFGTSTSVGLRNSIFAERFIRYSEEMPEDQILEKHYILLVDNAKSNFVDVDKNMRGLLLQGISRNTDEWRTAGEKLGSVMIYCTFCRKLITSCFPVNDAEVQRRCILVNCEKVEKKNTNLIDLKLCNFDWSEHILKFWGDYERARAFTMLGLEYPRDNFQGETARINYYQDIYSLFRMFGISDPMDRINAFENRDFNLAKDSSLDQMLKLFIEGLDDKNSIKNSTLSRFITSRVSQNEIERPSAKEIRDAMYRLGYVEKWSDTDLRWIK